MTNGNHDAPADGKIRSIAGKLISITAPALNEGENLAALCRRITAALTPITHNFEIVIADNASSDDTLPQLRRLSAEDPRVKYVRLSRNFGHQGGLIAGMHHCAGEIVITMDADLQHPPEVLPKLLERWEEGFDVVGTRKRPSGYTNPVRQVLNSVFYRVVGKSIGIPLTQHQSDFRLLDRAALNALLALPERQKFLRGLSHWIGFPQTSIEFEPSARQFGKTKFRFLGLLAFAIHGVISFSVFPLRLFTVIGMIVAALALGNAAYLIVDWLTDASGEPPPGWLTLATGVYFLGGLQLVGIGVLGEYLALTLVESRRRPSFIVAEASTPMYVPVGAAPPPNSL
ncbi:MAG TPA: glycosyltransferase [Rhodospirillaceae bacterium]|nr:glycosyltransferase [Rhodospirillaceae bacterium]|tara:strand:+ start:24349 stop:25377 length:1029 start_codon:yes stop_codon:yes gene_type:complete